MQSRCCAVAAALALAAVLTGCRRDAAFTYETDALCAVNPAEITHHEVAAWRVALPSPAFLAALPDDRVVVVGGARGLVLRTNGIVIATFSWSNAGVATAVAAAPDGRVYVGASDRVVVLTPGADVAPVVWESLGENARVTGVAADARQVWLCDAGQRRVWRFDRDGRLLGQTPAAGATGAPQFIVPSPYFACAAAGDGSCWVVNPGQHALLRLADDGRVLAGWSRPGMATPGFCGCCNPAYIALLPDGSLITSEKQAPRIKIYSAEGVYRGVVAAPTMLYGDTAGRPVAADKLGRVWALDGDRVRVFAPR